jgi:transposase
MILLAICGGEEALLGWGGSWADDFVARMPRSEWIEESNPVRAVDAFVDALDLGKLGLEGVVPEVMGRPSYHPSALLKSRSMATSGRGSSVVGYNVQVAVDIKNHIIVTHEVTNVGSCERRQRSEGRSAD